MKNSLKINSYIAERMHTYRTGGDSDRPMSYRDAAASVGGISHNKWYQMENLKTDEVGWDIWEPVWRRLVKEGLIDPDELELMPPSALVDLVHSNRMVRLMRIAKDINDTGLDILTKTAIGISVAYSISNKNDSVL